MPEVETADERKYEKQLVGQAQQMFKSIQGFMGDRHYSFPVCGAALALRLLCGSSIA